MISICIYLNTSVKHVKRINQYLSVYIYIYIYIYAYMHRQNTDFHGSPCKLTGPTVGSKKLKDGVRRILAGIAYAPF